MTPEEIKAADRRADERTAKEIVQRIDPHILENQCRAAASWLGRDEENWKSLTPLLEAIELGRLTGMRNRVRTPEEIESWYRYLSSR